jgi:hypothetical protein
MAGVELVIAEEKDIDTKVQELKELNPDSTVVSQDNIGLVVDLDAATLIVPGHLVSKRVASTRLARAISYLNFQTRHKNIRVLLVGPSINYFEGRTRNILDRTFWNDGTKD